MSSEHDERAARPSEDPAASGDPTPGALLKQERIRRGLSVQQAAEGLHLDPWIVEAIEANQFLALGAPVYAKGYLRKYAVLLELAPEVIVARYEALSDTPEVPTPVPLITTTPPPRPKWPQRLAWSLLAVLLAVLGWLAFDVLMPPVSTPSLQPQPTATTSGQAAALISDPQPLSAAVSPAVMTTEAAVATPATSGDVTQAAAAAPSTNEGATLLRLEFSEASWVEVYDASGQRLLYDVGLPDRARAVSGQAPLSVVIGLASAVTAHVNDRQIVVPRRAGKDSTRFTVGADGSVQ